MHRYGALRFTDVIVGIEQRRRDQDPRPGAPSRPAARGAAGGRGRRRRRPRRHRMRRGGHGRARPAAPVAGARRPPRRSCRPPPRPGTRSTSPAAASRTSSRMPALPVSVLESGEVDAALLTGVLRRLQPVLRRVRRPGGGGRPRGGLGRRRTPAGRSWPRRCTPTLPPPPCCASGSVPVYPSIESAVAALAALLPRPPAPGVARAAGRAAVARSSTATSEPGRCSRPRASNSSRPAASWPAATSRRPLAELGYPVVVKALGTLHKSDAGGVVVGIAGPDELRATVADLRRRPSPRPASRSSAWLPSTRASS